MPAKLFFEGTSGFVVEAAGYPVFFSYTACLSIPGLLLIWYLVRRGGVFKTTQAAARVSDIDVERVICRLSDIARSRLARLHHRHAATGRCAASSCAWASRRGLT